MHPADLDIGQKFVLTSWPGKVKGVTYGSCVETVIKKGSDWIQSRYESKEGEQTCIHHRSKDLHCVIHESR